MTEPSPIRFTLTLRIYWEDTDAGGIVFYANYLKFFERARTEWLRSLGFGQEALRVESDAMFVVVDTRVRYLKPARLDDLLNVTVQVTEVGKASMGIAQVASREGERLSEGDIRIGCVHAQTLKPRRFPPQLLSLLS